MFCTAGVAQPCEISAGKETGLIASALPADGTPAARFHARISARPAFKGGYAKSSRFHRTEECVLTVQPMLQMGQLPPRRTSSATARCRGSGDLDSCRLHDQPRLSWTHG